MKRPQIHSTISQKIEALGIPAHLVKVRNVPSSVEAEVVFGLQRIRISARSGTSEDELGAQLSALEQAWEDRSFKSQQIDIEEVVGTSP